MIDLNSMMGKPSATTETNVEATKAANVAFNGIGGASVAPSNIFEGLNDAVISMNDFTELEAGVYPATVSKITVKLSKNNSPLGVVEYTVLDGPKAKQRAFQTLFFAQQDGTLNTRNVSALARILKVVNSATEEQAIEGAKKLLIAFGQGGQKTIVVDSTNGLVANNGTLKISEYRPEPKDGQPAVDRVYRNFMYTAA